MRRSVLLVMCLLLLLDSPPALALPRLTRSVAANGGRHASAAGRTLSGTLGQPAIGPMTGADSFLGLGFWYGPPPIQTAVPDPEGGGALSYRLIAGYPNPSPRATTIAFTVPRRTHVTIRLYDLAGRLVKTLTDEGWDIGTHRLFLDAGDIADGLYLCRMTAEGYSGTQRLVFVK